MKSEQIELMQHALGINERQREPYRNYFLASGGNAANPDWQELVTAGYATSSPAPAWSCGDVVYQVTDKGRELAVAALPMPKKKKETLYDKFLDYDCCQTFTEFLLGNRAPQIESRIGFKKGKYRMYRELRCEYYGDIRRDVEGDWCDTVTAAKASYKQALKAYKAKHRSERAA